LRNAVAPSLSGGHASEQPTTQANLSITLRAAKESIRREIPLKIMLIPTSAPGKPQRYGRRNSKQGGRN
jgi:hypothetical protein